MPLWTLLLAGLIGLGASARAGDPTVAVKQVDELRALTQRRFDANAANDRAFYEKLLAPNFQLLAPFSFPAKDKKAYLDEEFPKGRPARPKSSISGFRAEVAGQSAVVSYEVTEPYPLGGGQDFKQLSRRLDTYVRIDGAWRLLSMGIAEPPSWPEPAKVGPGLYSEYSGSYRMSPEALALVTNEDGHLMLQLPGQSKVELFPESATSFFDKTDSPLARTSFERDALGQVVAQVYRSGGQQLRSPKVAPAAAADASLRVVLLGTASGPTFPPQRLGIATLVEAGSERILFDAGRSLTTGMARLSINPADVTKVFLTHLHSDHIISLPELWLFSWPQGRKVPLQVWGPEGTRAMWTHLQEAFAFDVHVRRDLDERFPAEGIGVTATDIREGVVYEANGVRVTAFLVDHGPVKPAYGYRVDYQGRSVVLSGDTKPSDNLVKAASGVDLLIQELGRWKQDPVMQGPEDEVIPAIGLTRRQARTIAEHHTDGVEAGRILQAAKPRLTVFSHFAVDPQKTLSLVRQNYAGPVEFGEDLMTVTVGPEVTVHRFVPPSR